MFQNCVTQLNSVFYMFDRWFFFKLKDALSLYINDSSIDPILLEERGNYRMLSFEKEPIRELSNSQALVLSVIRMIQMMMKKLDDHLTK